MGDTCIIHEGLIAHPVMRGWTVTLSDGAVFSAVAPHEQNERWAVTLVRDDHTYVGHRTTLPAALDVACRSAGYEARTGHVLATLAVHLS